MTTSVANTLPMRASAPAGNQRRCAACLKWQSSFCSARILTLWWAWARRRSRPCWRSTMADCPFWAWAWLTLWLPGLSKARRIQAWTTLPAGSKLTAGLPCSAFFTMWCAFTKWASCSRTVRKAACTRHLAMLRPLPRSWDFPLCSTMASPLPKVLRNAARGWTSCANRAWTPSLSAR